MDAGTVLQIFGVTSLLGVMAFLINYYDFPPNLSVEEGKYKGKHNFESRFIVQNIGKMPAYNVVIDVKNMNFRVGGINTEDMNTENCGVPNHSAGGDREDGDSSLSASWHARWFELGVVRLHPGSQVRNAVAVL